MHSEGKATPGAKNRIIIGVSGASGMDIAAQLLRAFGALDNWETHLIMTDSACTTLLAETDYTPEQFRALADRVYDNRDMGAAVASGSFRTAGMIVVPCSMKTVGGIASGYSDNLLLRAADVVLKESRPLVLGVRETPLSPVHLRNLADLAQIGARILPLMMTYYIRPKSIDDMSRHLVGKILDQFGLDLPGFQRWS